MIYPDSSFFEPNQRLHIRKHFDVKSVEKILVIGIDQLGGLMMTSPFFRELRSAFPDAYIVNLVGPLTYGVMRNCPYVDEVWLFDKKKSFQIAKEVRQQKFDLSFDLSGTFRTAAITLLGGVKNKVGYGSDGASMLMTVKLNQELHSRYRPENVFDMLRALGFSPKNIYQREVWVSDEDEEYAKAWAENHQVESTPILAFNPYSTDPKRRWTETAWKETLLAAQSLGMRLVMMVAPNELEPGEALLKQWQVEGVDIESHTVTQTAAILKYIKVAVGPESGFIHMAVASGNVHAIALFNVLPPVSTFPIQDDRHASIIMDELPCAPCYLYKFKDQCPNGLVCMSTLPSERVVAEIKKFLDS